ncbi:MAG: MATE family efflux transporter [Lachnoclostridium sp.]|nr:MATE family efflux transporter [Lachnoclostridium sp.]
MTGAEQLLLDKIRDGKSMKLGERLRLIVMLSIPAILAQVSLTAMFYIDASMVGSLGAEASASVGLVTTTTWLFGGLCSAGATAFSVQVAHRLGASDLDGARSVVRQGTLAIFIYGMMLMATGVGISPFLPGWLGGNDDIVGDASSYFLIYSSFLPIYILSYLAGGVLRCSGDMRTPSGLSILMCVLDVVFNFFLIFPTREVSLLGASFNVPGADMGVQGAALGTGLAETVTAILMTWVLWRRSPQIDMRVPGSFAIRRPVVSKAFRIGAPMALQSCIMCGAQIMSTVIVAPLGTIAIAANSFAITAESLCYMPGFGVSEAATTIIGQCVGARRRRLTRELAYLCVGLGMAVMAVMGVVMYGAADLMIGFMTPIDEIRTLGASILRIEAWAEPMFAAAIVSYGVFVGAGDTLIPSCMNFGSIWLVRLSLAALLAPTMGLTGVWIAMAVELTFRGLIFLLRLRSSRWLHNIT